MNRAGRLLTTAGGLILLWYGAWELVGRQDYLLPSPLRTLEALITRWDLILRHAALTAAEIGLGLVCGVVIGSLAAILLVTFRPMRRWLLPLLVMSQALPVFAIAPLLVLWLGYGMGSKVAMATLIITFPVASALYDGLRRTERGWLDLADVMGANRWTVLWRVRLPAALPAFASGLRVAAAVAPIGAVVGEWVGSSGGLGYLMLHANARMQIDIMFAALLVLTLLAVGLYTIIDALLRRALPWAPDSLPPEKD